MALSQTTQPRDQAPLRRELRPSGPVSLSLTESHRSGTTVIAVSGELDILTAPKVAAQLDEVVRTGSDDVVVDLRKTTFIDSAGLFVLLNARRRLTRLSRVLSVVCGSGPVRSVLELARLTETLGVVSELEQPGR
jgi:anti-sigma B factor antagonist